MTNANSTPAATDTPKGIQLFYTQKDSQGTKVSLWLNQNTKDGAPDVDGSIGDRRVAGYIRSGANGGFVSFIDSKAGKGDDGKYTQVGTGNVIVNSAGIPKLAIKLEGVEGTVWAETSLKAEQDMLVAMGLNLEIQAAKKAEAAQRRAQPSEATA